MEIPLYVVDAFTSTHFAGNPAAVCPLNKWLDDSLLQAIAAESNPSETAFFVPEKSGYALRWFTPKVEVDLCGHATLACAFVLSLKKSIKKPLQFHTKSGELSVSFEDQWFTLDFPTRALEEPDLAGNLADKIESACGIRPLQVTRSEASWIAEFANEGTIKMISPDFQKVAQLDCRGLIVTAKGDKCDFVSRFFAPKVGIDEDPVTGSIHCALIPYWHRKIGKAKMTARQVSSRGGELRCCYAGERVQISGQAVLFSQGKILI